MSWGRAYERQHQALGKKHTGDTSHDTCWSIFQKKDTKHTVFNFIFPDLIAFSLLHRHTMVMLYGNQLWQNIAAVVWMQKGCYGLMKLLWEKHQPSIVEESVPVITEVWLVCTSFQQCRKLACCLFVVINPTNLGTC